MRISDWSSDVCSSDLTECCSKHRLTNPHAAAAATSVDRYICHQTAQPLCALLNPAKPTFLILQCQRIGEQSQDRVDNGEFLSAKVVKIGRASCRARVCTYV